MKKSKVKVKVSGGSTVIVHIGLDSGNFVADSQFYSLSQLAMYESGYSQSQFIAEFRNLIDHFPNYKEKIAERLKFALSTYIEKQSGKHSDWRTNRVAARSKQRIAGTISILKWLDGIRSDQENRQYDSNRRTTLGSYLYHNDPIKHAEFVEVALPIIVAKYKNSRPRDMACLIVAMMDLAIIERADISSNFQEFHDVLTKDFGTIGKRFSLHKQLFPMMDGASRLHEVKIEECKEFVRELIPT